MTLSPAPSTPLTSRQVVKRAVRLPTAHRFGLAWRLGRHREVPLRARLPLMALIVYLALPLDIIPDCIPVIGQLDDLLIAGIAVWWFLHVCPPQVALAEIARLEATPLGRVGRWLPWLLGIALAALLLIAVVWFIRR